jgi:hypothetical protein
MANSKISELTEKTTPADSDVFPLVDYADTPTTKKSTWANIKATLKTYFDSIYQASLGFIAAPRDITINEQVDSYTLVLTDNGKLIDMNKATAITLTVPKYSSVAYPTGATIAIRQKGAGAVTIAPVDGDVTIQYAEGLDLTGQHAVAALIKVAENTWVAVGSLEA